MAKTSKISTLHGFMTWVKKISGFSDAGPEKVALLYRGHANRKWQLQPSIYREDGQGKSYRAHEYELYQEMLRRNPDAFGPDKSIFDRLIRMQHNGLPTRLLDLTENPLIALFFACENEFHEDGEVLLFRQIRSIIAYPHAIPDASLAGLERKLQFSFLGRMIHDRLDEFLKINEKSKCECISVEKEYRKLIQGCRGILMHMYSNVDRDDLISISVFLNNINDAINSFCNESNPESLKNECASDEIYLKTKLFVLDFESAYRRIVNAIISDFSEDIGITYNRYINIGNFVSQFTTFNFVYPQLNNERIKRQQGLFIIWPPMENKNWGVEKFCCPSRVLIKADAKKKILKELASLGITRSYLYPELPEQAKDIKELYPPL
ncbi:FRG domain-containing protein [Citrobacter amalonaticus]|uniref:FRG domain-containing protein n=1 Tax=Citrobacter amalonaticus TaxID=35703 RepID=UPI00300D02DB